MSSHFNKFKSKLPIIGGTQSTRATSPRSRATSPRSRATSPPRYPTSPPATAPLSDAVAEMSLGDSPPTPPSPLSQVPPPAAPQMQPVLPPRNRAPEVKSDPDLKQQLVAMTDAWSKAVAELRANELRAARQKANLDIIASDPYYSLLLRHIEWSCGLVNSHRSRLEQIDQSARASRTQLESSGVLAVKPQLFRAEVERFHALFVDADALDQAEKKGKSTHTERVKGIFESVSQSDEKEGAAIARRAATALAGVVSVLRKFEYNDQAIASLLESGLWQPLEELAKSDLGCLTTLSQRNKVYADARDRCKELGIAADSLRKRNDILGAIKSQEQIHRLILGFDDRLRDGKAHGTTGILAQITEILNVVSNDTIAKQRLDKSLAADPHRARFAELKREMVEASGAYTADSHTLQELQGEVARKESEYQEAIRVRNGELDGEVEKCQLSREQFRGTAAEVVANDAEQAELSCRATEEKARNNHDAAYIARARQLFENEIALRTTRLARFRERVQGGLDMCKQTEELINTTLAAVKQLVLSRLEDCKRKKTQYELDYCHYFRQVYISMAKRRHRLRQKFRSLAESIVASRRKRKLAKHDDDIEKVQKCTSEIAVARLEARAISQQRKEMKQELVRADTDRVKEMLRRCGQQHPKVDAHRFRVSEDRDRILSLLKEASIERAGLLKQASAVGLVGKSRAYKTLMLAFEGNDEEEWGKASDGGGAAADEPLPEVADISEAEENIESEADEEVEAGDSKSAGGRARGDSRAF